MKMNYSKPVVQAMDMVPAYSIMQAASNFPSFNGTPIEDGGIQDESR